MSGAYAFQGERGAFSEEALRRFFGEGAEVLPCPSFRAVFDAVASGIASGAMIPIENSRAGSIVDNFDLLLEHPFTIVGEVFLPVRQSLLAVPGQRLEEIREARSHPQALAQSDEFLRAHAIRPVVAYDTAGAARDLGRERLPGVAAIASARAAAIYGLEVLVESIQTSQDNTTRFFAVVPAAPAGGTPRPEAAAGGTPRSEGAPKTTVVLATRNAPGTLHACLAAFAERGLNLTKLESRPSHETPWDYVFYLDYEGDAASGPGRDALTALEGHTQWVRVLGTYPRASMPGQGG